MADNIPQASVNSELISAGLDTNNPAMTTVNFANAMTNARQSQDAQTAAVARAQQLAKQSAIDTSNQEEAQAAGVNPLLSDTMTPEEAVAYLKIILKEKGLEEDDDLIDSWAKTLPKRVNRQIVEAFASRFARETSRAGQAAKFDTSMKVSIPEGSTAEDLGLVADPNNPKFGHVPEDGMYQVLYDNQGNILKLIPGGKEAADPSLKIGQKQDQFDATRWSKLEGELSKVVQSSRGNQLSSAVYRADRALNELAQPDVLIPQVLSFIGKDLSGIFQGGVPPATGMEKEEFETAFQALNRFVQKYTGFTAMFKTDTGDQRKTLTDLVVRLRDSTLEILDAMMKGKLEGYRDIIDKDPTRWQNLLQAQMDSVKSGLTNEAKTTSSATTQFPAQKYPTNTPAASGNQPKKVVPKYEVIE